MCCEADSGVVVAVGSAFFVVVLPRGGCEKHCATPVLLEAVSVGKQCEVLSVVGRSARHSRRKLSGAVWSSAIPITR